MDPILAEVVMTEFKNITMNDKDCLKEFLINSGNYNCEMSFGNNVLWDKDHLLQYVIYRNVLIYRMVSEEGCVYCTPDFKGKYDEILGFIDKDAALLGKNYKITCLSAEDINKIDGEAYEITTDRNYTDYIYLVDKLVALSGSKLRKKKNHLNYFLKNYKYSYENISYDNKEECKEMKNKWLLTREEVNESLLFESSIIDKALDNFEEFDFMGGLIRVNGEVKAFTLGEKLNNKTFVTHIEKAMDDMRGLYNLINWEFAKELQQLGYSYVNREEDMGIEGLRKAKLSYEPEMLQHKYVATRNL